MWHLAAGSAGAARHGSSHPLSPALSGMNSSYFEEEEEEMSLLPPPGAQRRWGGHAWLLGRCLPALRLRRVSNAHPPAFCVQATAAAAPPTRSHLATR